MHKHVRPAEAGAAIPDPAHRRDLPQEGIVVEWSPHWALLALRGDVIVSECDEAGGDENKRRKAPRD